MAGLRIDAVRSSTQLFPLHRVDAVRDALADTFASLQPAGIVASAACGGDLLALAVAGECGVLRRIVLPYEISRFRATSVVDRPGNWGAIFDRVIAEVSAECGTVVLTSRGRRAFSDATARIVLDAEEAARIHGATVEAVLVGWSGSSRRGSHTAALRRFAVGRGWPVHEIPIGV